MKRVVIVLALLLVISMVSAETVKIGDMFRVFPNHKTFNSEREVAYFYAGDRLIANKDNLELSAGYHYSDIRGSDIYGIYLPFGQELIDSRERFEFTGKELDESGLNYFGARYYDSGVGKFTSTDPVKDNHAYGYVANNPMNFVDSEGMEEKTTRALVIIANKNSDWNGAVYRGLDYEFIKIRSNFDQAYVDTVSTPEEYFEAYDKGVEALGGKFNFYYGTAHGYSIGITLDKGVTLWGSEFQDRDLSVYFEEGAWGCQSSCSVADTTITNNFAKELSNSAGIPITGLIHPGSAMLVLSDDLMLTLHSEIRETAPGLNPSGSEGCFESSNRLKYFIDYADGVYTSSGYTVRGMSYEEAESLARPNPETGEIPLPSDFDPSEIYHYTGNNLDNTFTHHPGIDWPYK